MLRIQISEKIIGGRGFLFVGTTVIPIDRIKSIDLHAANGSASDNSVRILTDDEKENFIWAHENATDLREYLLLHGRDPEGE